MNFINNNCNYQTYNNASSVEQTQDIRKKSVINESNSDEINLDFFYNDEHLDFIYQNDENCDLINFSDLTTTSNRVDFVFSRSFVENLNNNENLEANLFELVFYDLNNRNKKLKRVKGLVADKPNGICKDLFVQIVASKQLQLNIELLNNDNSMYINLIKAKNDSRSEICNIFCISRLIKTKRKYKPKPNILVISSDECQYRFFLVWKNHNFGSRNSPQTHNPYAPYGIDPPKQDANDSAVPAEKIATSSDFSIKENITYESDCFGHPDNQEAITSAEIAAIDLPQQNVIDSPKKEKGISTKLKFKLMQLQLYK